MKADLAISPCPNDTYIFYAMLHKPGLLPGSDLTYNAVFEDVEELNRRAIQEARHPVSKMSYFAYLRCEQSYVNLKAGGALGRGCGPLLISSKQKENAFIRNESEIAQALQKEINQGSVIRILVPGLSTTAYMLLRMYLAENGIDAQKVQTIPIRYDRILPSLQLDEADCGLIIHEERFTYPDFGLQSMLDLGQWWEEYTGLPIPLGLIAVRNDFSDRYMAEVENTIKKSLQYARDNESEAWPFIKEYAQTLSDNAIRQHIDLYVNDYSMDTGTEGESALQTMRKLATSAGLI